MIFDICGVINFQDSISNLARGKVQSSFSGYPWNQLDHPKIIDIEQGGVAIHSLGRFENRPEITSYLKTTFIIIGEAFNRWDSPSEDVISSPRLSAEDLAQRYSRSGLAFIKTLKGNFYVVIINHEEKEALLISSRFSIIPLYYYSNNSILFFSTSLGELAKILPVMPSLDKASILEVILFNFPMWERTFFDGIKRISQGHIYRLKEGSFSSEKYWDHKLFYTTEKIQPDEAMEVGSLLFSKSVNSLVQDKENICVSFTSGFDSRVVHSVLKKDRQHVLAYSFGIRGSMNVSVPQKLCADMHYPFRPIYLEEEYENSFSDYAWQSVILSDGLVVQRANYPYAFKKISDFSDVVMTGLFGSEFLRTFQNLGTVVSAHFARINDANGDLEILTGIMDQLQRNSYLSAEIFEPSPKNEVIADVRRWFDEYGNYPRDQRIYLYLLTEVSRKYFAAELSTERIYATSRLPFLDDEFVEFIFKAPFAGVYSKTITPSVENRFKSQQFYAYIIKKFKPELLKYFTDHGYPPGDLLSPFSFFLVGVKNLVMRLYKKVSRYDEFRPRKWMKRFYSENSDILKNLPLVSGASFQQALVTGRFIDDLDEFNKVGAVGLWLKFIKDSSFLDHPSSRKNSSDPKEYLI